MVAASVFLCHHPLPGALIPVDLNSNRMRRMISFRRPADEHIVVKEGEQYATEINDTGAIGEEVNISYTVTRITSPGLLMGM